MKQKSLIFNSHWAWLLPLMLLLVWVVGLRLDVDGFWYDEVFTVRNAAGAGYGPLSLTGQYQTIQRDDPYQAIGYPFAVTAWGYLVGWSEFALRVSSLLFTVIAMALTYRLGADVTQNRWTGVVSAMIFAFSTFTVHYSHELRAFTFVTIFAALLIWAYWRILQNPTRTGYLWFVIGGTGLLYAHYYAAMLLIALAVYHLIFVPKNRAWLMVPLCGLVMVIAFIPQFPVFIEGFTRFDPADVEKTPMRADAVISSLVYYIGNGMNPVTLATMAIGLVLVIARKTPVRIVVVIAIFGTAVLIISNEWLDILEPTRLRYAIFLWPLYAVWIAYALDFVSRYLASIISQRNAQIALFLLVPVLWFANALLANFTAGFNTSIEGTETPRLRTITNVLREEGANGDLFAFYNGTSAQAWYIQDTLTYSVWDLPMPTMTTASLYDVNPDTRAWANEQIEARQRVWYGANRTFGLNEVHDDFLALMDEGFVVCATPVMNNDLSLQLFARSEVFCNNGTEAQIGGFTLTDSALLVDERQLTIQLGFALDETITPDTYSVSTQLQSETGEIVLTQDAGIPYDRFVPMQLTLDTSEIDAGDYTVLLVIYAWQTGERLTANGSDTYPLGNIILE